MTTHDDMCTCDRCMREDHDRTLQRVGDLERENARLREALSEARRAISSMHGARAAVAVIDAAIRRQDGPS
jgi:phage host-nuclease inhibitor protein Gam